MRRTKKWSYHILVSWDCTTYTVLFVMKTCVLHNS